VAEHPYPCDEAALHHICDGGWMWVLRFENGITSAGFALDIDRHPLDDSLSPEEEFHRRLAMYPSIEEQFRPTRMSESFPSRVPIRTGRIQRLWDHAAGDRWCLLPNAAGFIDPFYSTGIAQTLCGVLRLGDAFRNWNRPETFLAKLAAYDRLVVREVRLIDQIVAASYASMGADPDLLHAASALYFAAATTFEQRFHGRSDLPAFLLADDPQFVGLVRLISGQIRETARQGAGGDVAGCVSATAAAIAPYNVAGLLAPEARHLYRRTAAK
jgi:FADH2 O2-dependent halogenase